MLGDCGWSVKAKIDLDVPPKTGLLTPLGKRNSWFVRSEHSEGAARAVGGSVVDSSAILFFVPVRVFLSKRFRAAVVKHRIPVEAHRLQTRVVMSGGVARYPYNLVRGGGALCSIHAVAPNSRAKQPTPPPHPL